MGSGIQYVWSPVDVRSSLDFTISRPVRASFTVRPDHQTKSCNAAGPWLGEIASGEFGQRFAPGKCLARGGRSSRSV